MKIFILLYLFGIYLSQQIKQLVEGQMETGFSTPSEPVYYKLTISSNFANKDLSFNVESKDNLKEFCDPDIYISKTNKYPNSTRNSEYYAYQYGPDNIVIPGKDLNLQDTLYVGIVSEDNCRFYLSFKVIYELEITGHRYNANIGNGINFLGYFWNNDPLSTFVEVNAFNWGMNEFKLYIAVGTTPSKENSILTNPGWMGGETVKIHKFSKNFCTNCKYYIYLHSDEKIQFNVHLRIEISGNFKKIRTNFRMPLFGFIDNNPSCYSYQINQDILNDNLIVVVTTFSGTIKLNYNGYNMPVYYDNDTKIQKTKYEFDLGTEEIIKITPEMREGNRVGEVYLCLTSDWYYTSNSYILKVFPESKTEEFQIFNILMKNIDLLDFVPSKEVTRFRVDDYSSEDDVTIRLTKTKGDPILYALVSDNFRIYFNSDYITRNDNILLKSSSIANTQTLTIKNSENQCHTYNRNNQKKNYLCGIYAIVFCNSTVECQFKISEKSNHKHILLNENVAQTHIVNYNDTNYFKFRVDDQETKEVWIILNSISGDADLYVSRTVKRPTSENNDDESVYPAFSRDYVTYRKKNTISLAGSYYVSVYGSTFSSYSIMFYTVNSSKLNYIDLKEGDNTKDVILKDSVVNYKIYRINQDPKSTDNIFITISRVLGYYDAYLYDNEISLQTDLNSEFKDIKKAKTNITDSNYFLLDNYNIKSNPLFVVVKKDAYFKIDDDLAYHIGFYFENRPVYLKDGLKLDFSYSNSNINKTFALAYNQLNTLPKVYLEFSKHTIIKYRTYSDSQTILPPLKNYIAANSLSFDEVLNCRSKESCVYYIYLEIPNENHEIVDFSVIAHLISNSTTKINKQTSYLSLVDPGQYKYFYLSAIGVNDSGLISVEAQSGAVQVVYSIFQNNRTNNKRNWIYPTTETFKGKLELATHVYIDIKKEEVAEKCVSNQCTILIGVTTPLQNNAEKVSFNIQFDSMLTKLTKKDNRIALSNEVRYFFFDIESDAKKFYFKFKTNRREVTFKCFMSHGSNDIPTLESADWKGELSVDEEVVVSELTDWIKEKGKVLSSRYILGIKTNFPGVYILSLNTNDKGQVVFVNNLFPETCIVTFNNYCYFRYFNTFKLEDDDEIVAIADFAYGNGTIYANFYRNITELNKGVLPTKDNYKLKSNSRESLKIKKSMLPSLIQDELFIIDFAVYCSKGCESLFTIMDSTSTIDKHKSSLDSFEDGIFTVKDYINIQSRTKGNYKKSLVVELLKGKITLSILDYKTNATKTIRFDLEKKSFDMIQNLDQFLVKVKNEDNDISLFKLRVIKDDSYNSIKINSDTLIPAMYNNPMKLYFYLTSAYDTLNLNLRFNQNDYAIVYLKIILNENYPVDEIVAPDENFHDIYKIKHNSSNNIFITYNKPKSDHVTFQNHICVLTVHVKKPSESIESYTFFNVTPRVGFYKNSTNIVKLNSFYPALEHLPVDPIDSTTQTFDMRVRDDDNYIEILILKCGYPINYYISENINHLGDNRENDRNYKTTKMHDLVRLDSRVRSQNDFYLTISLDHNAYNSMCGGANPTNYICKSEKAEYMVGYYSGLEKDHVDNHLEERLFIEWSQKEDTINLEWTRLNDDKLNFGYMVYVTENKDLFERMNSYCFYENINYDDKGLVFTMQNSISIPINKNTTVFYASVISGLNIYPPIEISIINKPMNVLRIVILVVVILILLYVIYFFYRRLKLTQKKLDFVVKEVPADGQDENQKDLENREKQVLKYRNLEEEKNV